MSKRQITNFFSPASKPGRSDGNGEQPANEKNNIATRPQANSAFRNTFHARPFVVMAANLHFRMWSVHCVHVCSTVHVTISVFIKSRIVFTLIYLNWTIFRGISVAKTFTGKKVKNDSRNSQLPNTYGTQWWNDPIYVINFTSHISRLLWNISVNQTKKKSYRTLIVRNYVMLRTSCIYLQINYVTPSDLHM